MSKQTKLIILFFCIVKLTLHLIADSHSGFQGDELLHIETGKHLAFGYMEFPPLIALFAFIQNLFGSNSVYIHHLFPHIASIIIIIYVAKTIIELGGKNKAIFLALFCIIIAPSFGRSQQLFQPVVFSQLFWVLSFYQLTKFVKYLDKRSLWYLTAFVVLGCTAKYDALFFISGLFALLLYKRTRQALLQQQFWKNIIVVILLLLPNLIWQYANNFPVLQMFNRLYETQLDKISRIESLGQLLMGINPLVSLLIILPAFIYLLKNNKSINRPLAVSILLSVLFLSFKNGKSYYFYPIVLTIIPFGALFWEQIVLEKKKWVIYPITTLLLLGAVLIPFGMPVYSFNRYLTKIYPFEKKEIEGGKYAIKYDEYYTKQKWQTTMQELKLVYDSLPLEERNICMIWGKHYGQAGAVNLLGVKYNLPKAFSYHGSFYSWTPKGQMPNTIIALSYRVGDFFSAYFDEVKLVRIIYNPYANNEEELYQRIYICKKPKQDFDKMKELFKIRIFE
ncbi:Dolichyl-phosphate-mannose-protein mannosyltransferase [Flavobacterium fryxellicola]|uniref:ArnT family glycosyltransferase n=1 Tax=Flavobacterium fryxellicola TaxID=249352 RepID=UPI000913CFBF|nr:glycosyltransferase family 39 protein [Flavobacterium fryxellicola]SHN57596.1 Dolichyl-phosphate-mannose-protein mannosyltransferase [Flavobacterium fryxellicola]